MTHSKKKAFFLGLTTHSSAFLENRESLRKHEKSLREEDLEKNGHKIKDFMTSETQIRGFVGFDSVL